MGSLLSGLKHMGLMNGVKLMHFDNFAHIF